MSAKIVYGFMGQRIIQRLKFYTDIGAFKRSACECGSGTAPAHFRSKYGFMRHYLSCAFLLFSIACLGQPLRDINYEYVYNPQTPVTFQLATVRQGTSFAVLYNLQVKDTTGLMTQYAIEWQGRSLTSDKEGTAITLNDHVTWRHAGGLRGQGTLS